MKPVCINLNKRFKIEFDLMFPAIVAAMFAAGYLERYMIIFISILAHEAGHIGLAKFFGKQVYAVKILPVGVNIELEECPDEGWKEIAIYLGGPFTNLLIFAACLIAAPYLLPDLSPETGDLYFYATANLYLALFNIIPVFPLDGGKIMRGILSPRIGLFMAANLLKKVSVLIIAILIMLGLVQAYNNLYNFNLLIIVSYIYFSLKKAETEASLMNVKNIFYRRSRLLKKGVYPARDLVVIKSLRMGDILKNMDFDRFHIIYVLSDELKLLKVYTEQEIIDGMLKYNSDLTFEEFMQKSV